MVRANTNITNISAISVTNTESSMIAELIRDGHKDYEVLEQLGAYFQ